MGASPITDGKELWAFTGNASRAFEYQFHDATCQWHAPTGTRTGRSQEWPHARRFVSINDVSIREVDRRLRGNETHDRRRIEPCHGRKESGWEHDTRAAAEWSLVTPTPCLQDTLHEPVSPRGP